MAKKAAQAIPNYLLRAARQERGWTQKDVADRIGAPLDLNVTRWERGRAKPSAYYVQKLCELFGKSPSELGLLPSQQETNSQRELEAERERPWNVPFGRNPFFTGRGQLLERLHAQLFHNQRAALTQAAALSGLGGIGKTQAAIEYAYRHRDEYTAVFWVRADSRETLMADYVAIARLLLLPGSDTEDQMQVVTTVKRWLREHESWLLMLDNADDLSLVPDFLPREGQGHLVLTTRAQATGKLARSLPVEKMEPSESMQLLLHRTRLLERDEPLDTVLQRAHILSERVLGPEHPRVAETLTGLAQLSIRQRRYAQAGSLLQRALAIDEHALGPEHPQTAATLDAQGHLALLEGREEQAALLLQRALALREHALGNSHPDVAHTLHHLAQLYKKQGKLEQAHSLYQQALSIREHALGPDHPDTTSVLKDYTALLRVM